MVLTENRITENQKKQRNAIPCFFCLCRQDRLFIFMNQKERDLSWQIFSLIILRQRKRNSIPFTGYQRHCLRKAISRGFPAKQRYCTALMIDRLGLNIRNQWFDSRGGARIHNLYGRRCDGGYGLPVTESGAPDERAGYRRRHRADREKEDRAWEAKPDLCEKFHGRRNQRQAAYSR